MLKLPSLEWFMGQINFRGSGNIYSGSFGCDPEKGDIDGNIFRFRVWIDKNENGELSLKAACYMGMYCYDATDKSIMRENTFSADADGIAEAERWVMKIKEEIMI